ncbi:MAG: GNAT family N-acetyltransferase [Rhizobiales bacterium]|nr:GNAT family N-acetyltransferase [Hyphomicrobiales bacterium]
MAFLRSVGASDNGPVLFGKRLTLRLPQGGDYVAWAELRARSREFLVPFEPAWSRDELSRAAFRRRLRFYHRELREETGYTFFLFRSQDDQLVGGVSLSQVRRGVTQSCTVGYWVGAPFARQGHMSDALGTVIPFTFGTLGLNRLEAACLTGNVASIGVLEKAGFQREGLARKYLRINGVWQDHFLYAMVAGDSGT